jgi:hypothetical protein
VLERFAHNGMRKEQVQRIQRVQNLHLYADYRRRRDKIEWLISQSTGGARVGALLNERLLFHGADKETLATIMSEGFDHRVSNTSGAMGAGVYFADTATYSDTYSRTPKHSADVAGSYGGVPGLVHLGGALRAGAQGVLSVAGAWANRSARAAPPPMAPAVRSAFLADCVSMLLCDVTLGIAGVGQPGMRRAAPGSHSSSSGPPGGAIHAVYYNDQVLCAAVCDELSLTRTASSGLRCIALCTWLEDTAVHLLASMCCSKYTCPAVCFHAVQAYPAYLIHYR